VSDMFDTKVASGGFRCLTRPGAAGRTEATAGDLLAVVLDDRKARRHK